jgi:molybdate transport system ATP-binding protein
MAEPELAVSLNQAGPIPLDIALSCAAGEVLALVGPSGSGKTTVLRCIAGLHRPAAGRITCHGRVWFDSDAAVWVPPHARAVGLVFQTYALFPHMSARQNLIAAMRHRPRDQREARARELLELMHLDGLSERRPAALSGGQQQRVAIARALARDPDALLLDEPFSAVDRTTRHRLYGELAELRAGIKVPVILVTHDFDEAARLATRMCLIDHGRLIQTGTPDEVLARPATPLAARLVDLQNIFDGRIERQAPPHTVIAWNGLSIAGRHRSEFSEGERVSWVIPATQVILHRGADGDSGPGANAIAATVATVTRLSESTRIIATTAHGARLAMTVPAHYARRTALKPGDAVTLRLLPEGIHLMAAE